MPHAKTTQHQNSIPLHLYNLRMTPFFGKTFSTFTDLLKYEFKLLQFF